MKLSVPELKQLSPNVKRGLVLVAVPALLAVWFGLRQCQVRATPSESAVQVLPPPLPSSDAGTGQPLSGASTPTPTTATISFSVSPPARATVHWGKRKLGRIDPGKPLVVVRPRDSGPLDVIIRAEGFLPVQTRAHTFSDAKLVVKLTPPDQTNTLLGYRVPLDAGPPLELDALQVDGGVPQFLPPIP